MFDIDDLIESIKSLEIDKIYKFKENINLGFNTFDLISRIYHRENLHSDIISTILDVNGNHNGGDIYLKIFLLLINKHKNIINFDYYSKNVKILREAGRRDITIYGSNNHVIIIENKVNNAGDTSNQIPNYVKDVKNAGKLIDAIVYLTLNQIKYPNEDTWQVDFQELYEIKSKLICLRVYNGTSNDLCNGWLKSCIEVTRDTDVQSILKQYKNILRYLARNQMDHEYYNNLNQYFEKNPQNCEIALSLADSLKEYPRFILFQILEYFKSEKKRFQPFKDVSTWIENIVYLDSYEIAGYFFNMDVTIPNLRMCTIDFSVRGDRKDIAYQKVYPEKVLNAMGQLEMFEWNSKEGRFIHNIECKFTDFKMEVIDFIGGFLSALIKYEDNIHSALMEIKNNNDCPENEFQI